QVDSGATCEQCLGERCPGRFYDIVARLGSAWSTVGTPNVAKGRTAIVRERPEVRVSVADSPSTAETTIAAQVETKRDDRWWRGRERAEAVASDGVRHDRALEERRWRRSWEGKRMAQYCGDRGLPFLDSIDDDRGAGD